MRTTRRVGGAIALVLLIGASAQADEDAVVRRAAELLEEITALPDSGIPAQFLREAAAITIVPHLVETQLGVGRKHGDGVFLRRNEKGEWGTPEFVRMGGLSAGLEAGHRVTDLVLIYRTRKAAEQDGHHLLTFGASFGLISRDLLRKSPHDPHQFRGPKADGTTQGEILTYARSRGHSVTGVRFITELKSRSEGKATEAQATPNPQPLGTDAPGVLGVPAAQPPSASPDADRLRAVLATLTRDPATVAAARGTGDSAVRPASGSSLSTTPAVPLPLPR